MNKCLLLTISLFVALSCVNLFAQNKAISAMTDVQNGSSIHVDQNFLGGSKSGTAVTEDVDIIWQIHESYAIGASVNYSIVTGKSVINWQLNDSRIAQYGETTTPDWEFATEADFTSSYGNKAGTLVVVADFNMLYVIEPSTGECILMKDMGEGCEINTAVVKPDGTGFFIGYTKANGTYFYEAYSSNNETPIWSESVSSRVVTMNISENGARMIVCTGQPLAAAIVVDPTTGDDIQELYYYNNSPTQAPGMDYDGEYLIITDFSGNATLYKWYEDEYEQEWKTSVASAGSSSTWGMASAISADGSTIAVGTLGFVTDGYMGALLVFNNFSSTPIWTKEDFGDEVTQIAISDDGSLIACVTYGPINHSKPDFFAFRKQSSTPISSLGTSGAFECISMSGDGSKCLIAGKGVHPREMGWGGQAYLVSPIPSTFGSLQGVVDLAGTNDDSEALITIEGLQDYFQYSASNGDYSIKYIPAGNYTITISKTGYYPQTFENVSISAGTTAQLDATLQATGSAITNLYASKGAGTKVVLRWDKYESSAQNINIYRKLFDSEPFTEIIAQVDASAVEYIDENVIPTKTYFYSVTAEVAENTESPFSNDAMGYPSVGRVTDEAEVYVGTVPEIDGIMSEGEWDDAFELESSDFLGIDGSAQPYGSVTLYFKSNGDNLYVASVNRNDNTLEANDRVAFYVDDNDNGTYEPSGDNSEGNYWMDYQPGGASTIRYRPIYAGQSVGDVVSIENPQIEASDATGVVVMEFVLPIGDLDYELTPNEDNKSGLYFYVRNSAAGNQDGLWPCDNADTFVPTGYGEIEFYAQDEVPPAPEDVYVNEIQARTLGYAPVSWELPDINDLDHFNVYVQYSINNKDNTVFETEGNQLILDFIGNNNFYHIYVTTVDKGGHESTPSQTVSFTLLGIEDSDVVSNVAIYPNPASSQVTISAKLAGQSTLRVLDITGKVVINRNYNNFESETFSVSDLPSGVYMIFINNNQRAISRKLIVE